MSNRRRARRRRGESRPRPTRTEATADADLAFILSAPLDWETSDWLSTTAGQAALALKASTIAAAAATYAAAVKTAKR